ncbi:MAG TPA: cation diffusion facilitator family transporter [Chryseosolibacter sp.]
MGHDHSHAHHHHSFGENEGTKNIIVAFWLNTAFALFEIAGGFYTNSVAILSDAVHDLGDSLSLGLAYYFQKKSRKQKDQLYTYGYRRFALLGAFINSAILVIGSVLIIREAITRFVQPEPPDAKGMVVLALIGLAVNGYALLRLKKGDSINEKVVALHFVEDVLGWVAVLIGSVVMIFADVPILDPILSVLISAYILFNVYKNLKSTFRILLQRRPDSVDEETIRKKILAVPGVKDLHDVHFWTMDGKYNIMTLHVVVDNCQSVEQRERIKKAVKHNLEHLEIQHSTVEIESEDHPC